LFLDAVTDAESTIHFHEAYCCFKSTQKTLRNSKLLNRLSKNDCYFISYNIFNNKLRLVTLKLLFLVTDSIRKTYEILLKIKLKKQNSTIRRRNLMLQIK
jgi:hypothetical protein